MSKVTPITKEAALAEADIVTEAAIHLGYVSSIADLVRTLNNIAGNVNGVGQLEAGSLEAAMHLIQHHVEVADKFIQQLGEEADARLREAAS